MNDTYARVAERLSVRNHFHAQAGQYMMEERMRLVKQVEELEDPENPGEPMEIGIEEVLLIQPAPVIVQGLLEGISHHRWSLAAPKHKRSSRRDPYGKQGSRKNTPDPHGKKGSRSSTTVNRALAITGTVAPQALPVPASDAPGNSLDWATHSSAYSELPRSTSLGNINQCVPTQGNPFVSRYPITVVPPP
jgi:hypothetical protein